MPRPRPAALLLVVALVAGCAGAPPAASPTAPPTDALVPAATPTATPEPTPAGPPLLKVLPVDLAAVDWAAVMAHADLYPDGAPIADYGFLHGAGTPNELRNPQPTFYVPLGTPVLAPVDGIVLSVQTLYSGDSTIAFASATGDQIAWETEHVENVLVRPGERVTAGQPVATVSDYLCFYSRKEYGNEEWCGRGIGMVELGYLVGGSVPKHLCPYSAVLAAPGALDTILASLADARSRIEAIAGRTLWDQAAWASPGCIVAEAIQG